MIQSRQNAPSGKFGKPFHASQQPESTIRGEESMIRRMEDMELRMMMMSREIETLRQAPPSSHLNNFEDMQIRLTQVENRLLERESKLHIMDQELNQLLSNIQTMQESHQGVSELKSQVGIQLDLEKKQYYELHNLKSVFSEEISRLGEICSALSENQSKNRSFMDSKLREVSHRCALNEKSLDNSRDREYQQQEAQTSWIKDVGLEVEQLRAETNRQASLIVEKSLGESQEQGTQSKMIQELRRVIVKVDEGFSDKLARTMEDITLTLKQHQQSSQVDRENDRDEWTTRIAAVNHALSSGNESLAVKLQQLEEQVMFTRVDDDARIATLQTELETKFHTLTSHLIREETTRIEAVQRVQEASREELSKLNSGGARQSDLDRLMSQVDELQEVVRAEVRSRIRHEAKAREHVENTALSLTQSNRIVQQEMKQMFIKLESQPVTQQPANELIADIARLENRISQETQNSRLGILEAIERINGCEAKIAKSAATTQMRLEKSQQSLAGMDERLSGHVAYLTNEFPALEVRVKQEVLTFAADSKVQFETAEFERNRTIEEIKLELAARISLASEDLAANQQVFQQELHSNYWRMQVNVDEALDSLDGFQAKQASENCIESILEEIEKEARFASFEIRAEEYEGKLQLKIDDEMKNSQDQFNSWKEIAETRIENMDMLQKSHLTKTQEALGSFASSLNDHKVEVLVSTSQLESRFQNELDKLKSKVGIDRDADESQLKDMQVSMMMELILMQVIETQQDENLNEFSGSLGTRMKESLTEIEFMKESMNQAHEISGLLLKKLDCIVLTAENEKREQKEEWEESLKDARYFDLEPENRLQENKTIVTIEGDFDESFVASVVVEVEENSSVDSIESEVKDLSETQVSEVAGNDSIDIEVNTTADPDVDASIEVEINESNSEINTSAGPQIDALIEVEINESHFRAEIAVDDEEFDEEDLALPQTDINASEQIGFQ